MKKLFPLFLFSIINICCLGVEIIEYNPSHKDAVMEICFQDPFLFFGGSHAVRAGFMSGELFESENKKGMETILNDSHRKKRVLIDSGKVIGFIEFFKTREMSLEALKQQMEAQNLPFNETQVLAAMPNLKRTIAECEEFIEIESIAVEKNYRGKRYGKALLKDAEATIKRLWPTINLVQLNVNEDNEVARKFYESEEFEVSANQPSALVMMKTVQYSKKLQ